MSDQTTVKKTATTTTGRVQRGEAVGGANRKARTRLPVKNKSGKKTYIKVASLCGFLFMVFGISIAIGLSDEGQINVSNVMSATTLDKSETSGSEDAKKGSSKQDTQQVRQSDRPNSGLVGAGRVERTPPPPKVETVATGTDALSDIATTIEDVLPEKEETEEEAEEAEEAEGVEDDDVEEEEIEIESDEDEVEED